MGLRRKNRQYPTGLQQCWMVWRHCCCRFGAYPLLVAPIITASCLLSWFSTAGCQFIDVTVGFTPSNPAWNQSNAMMGLYFYQSDNTNSTGNKYRDTFHAGCKWYPDQFETDFMDKDRTWKVSRIMGLIAGIGSLAATIISWMVVFTNIPAHCMWPGLLLPVVMVSFIAEGSKFLILDVAICRNALWYPFGSESQGQPAESCKLGESAIITIAAGSLMLISLLMVCLHAPERRELDPDYGVYYTTGADHYLEEDEVNVIVGSHHAGSTGAAHRVGPSSPSKRSQAVAMAATTPRRKTPSSKDVEVGIGVVDENCIYVSGLDSRSNNNTTDSDTSSGKLKHSVDTDIDSSLASSKRKHFADMDIDSSVGSSDPNQSNGGVSNDQISIGMSSSKTRRSRATTASSDSKKARGKRSEQEVIAKADNSACIKEQSGKPPSSATAVQLRQQSSNTSTQGRISESRLNKMETMKKNATAPRSDDMIANFVKDLNSAFQDQS